MEFRNLRADEIELRVGNVSVKGATLLLYKDARVDMTILDETLGSENWQRDHKELKGNMYGGVGTWDKEKLQWIWKWDCGSESFTEKEKGEASDSFKRACVNLGIGRELYTSPFIFVMCPTQKKEGRGFELVNNYEFSGVSVKKIGYTGKTITELILADKKGLTVFNFQSNNKVIEYITQTMVEALEEKIMNVSINPIKVLEKFKIKNLSELPLDELVNCNDALDEYGKKK